MNNTTKAKYELAQRMLKGHIPVSEVVMMTELPKNEVQKMADEMEEKNPEAKAFKNLDFNDIDFKEVLFDDTIAPDELRNMPDEPADVQDESANMPDEQKDED